MWYLLALWALIGSGITAGVLFAVALSVVPALLAMPVGRYVEAHRLLGRNWDPTMPIIVLTTTAADVTLAVMADSAARRGTFLLAAVLMLAVAGVSHLLNVPLNRAVKGLDPQAPVPDGWHDPRPTWRSYHLLRTVIAVAAFAVTVGSVLLTSS